MISANELVGPSAALAAGIVTSLHCAGMCGPLACAACTSPGKQSGSLPAATYHLSRMTSYLLLGAVAGALGSGISEALLSGATRSMTWVFALFFLAVAVGLDKRLRFPSGGLLVARGFQQASSFGPVGKAGTLGFLTPLLPCAPLYLVVAAAALSGSAFSGALLMTSFGIGTIPLLFLVQNRLSALGGRWSAQRMDLLRRGLALTSVVLLVVRGSYTASTGCPMCH